MNNEDILRMANEADLAIGGMAGMVALRKFVSLVQAATAEECAKVCDILGGRIAKYDPHDLVKLGAISDCAKAIRTKYQDQAKSSGAV